MTRDQHLDQHLDRLEIRGFRGLSQLDVDGLGRFNVLIGANDVGKTSVLAIATIYAQFEHCLRHGIEIR